MKLCGEDEQDGHVIAAQRAAGLGCPAGQPLLNLADKRLGFVPGEHS